MKAKKSFLLSLSLAAGCAVLVSLGTLPAASDVPAEPCGGKCLPAVGCRDGQLPARLVLLLGFAARGLHCAGKLGLLLGSPAGNLHPRSLLSAHPCHPLEGVQPVRSAPPNRRNRDSQLPLRLPARGLPLNLLQNKLQHAVGIVVQHTGHRCPDLVGRFGNGVAAVGHPKHRQVVVVVSEGDQLLCAQLLL